MLAGEVWAAREHLRPLLSLTAKHGAAPELYDIVQKVRHALVYTLSGVLHRAACYVNFVLAIQGPIHFGRDSPLRPELLESIYHVFSATRDHALLHAAGDILAHMKASTCGWHLR